MSDKVFVFSKFHKRWVEYSGTEEEALEGRNPEQVFVGENQPLPWYRSPLIKQMSDAVARKQSARERMRSDGEPTPGIFRDKD